MTKPYLTEASLTNIIKNFYGEDKVSTQYKYGKKPMISL